MTKRTMTPEQLTENLKNALGDALRTVVLYGSTAKDDQTRRFSDYNVLILLRQIDVDTLRTMQPMIEKWIRHGNPSPVLFTEQRFQDAADVFPIEFMDMNAAHRLLYGADPFATLSIQTVHLRHELEYELQSKLIHLRHRYLESRGNPKQIRKLVAKSISSFAVLFQTVLVLLNETPPVSKKDIFEAVSRHVAIDVEAMEILLEIRDGDPRALRFNPEDLLDRLMRSVEAVVDFVNGIDSSSPRKRE